MTVSTTTTTVSTQPTTGLSTIDFLNGNAICILVKEGAIDSYTGFSFADGKEDFFSLMKRNFTSSVEIEGSVVTRLEREEKAEVYIYLPWAFRSTSCEETWRAICRLGNELITKAHNLGKEAEIAKLKAQLAALRA